jgi:hypothetical protein
MRIKLVPGGPAKCIANALQAVHFAPAHVRRIETKMAVGDELHHCT